ncbi:MAG: PaaI family thioesterase [Anaerolineae bacterium]|nr:PaaI family thioesterase [Anaerolineae bacterium]
MKKAIQDYYNPQAAICYGCGINNEHGLHIKTYWDGEIGHSKFLPHPEHTAFPGYVYGGLLASLIDCHSIGTAIAAMYDAEGRSADTAPEITCVTANLNVSFKQKTPTGTELVLRATIKELTAKKALVMTEIWAHDVLCVVGEVVAVRVSSRLFESSS